MFCNKLSSKRIVVTEILKLAGVSDPRLVDALAQLSEAQFQFGPSDVKIEPEKLSGSVQFSVNGEPVTVEVTFRSKLVQQMDAFLVELGLKPPTAPAMMQASPSEKKAPVDFLAPAATTAGQFS